MAAAKYAMDKHQHHMKPEQSRTRLDKWLWAARFFKTRSLAQQAVTGGKVHLDGQRVKAGHLVRLGARLNIRRGFEQFEVVVTALSETRGSAQMAQQLYQESEQSQQQRLREAELRRANAAATPYSDGRPDKRQRRQLQQFRQHQHHHEE